VTKVTTGLENFLARAPKWAARGRIGLLCNQASVDSRFRHAACLVAREYGSRLTALLSPQHGLRGEKQDNMVESPHLTDRSLGIPVYSLYADVRRPTEEMLSKIDILVVDLQEAGCRVYTFITTLLYCLEEAARLGKKIVVLDRPNPIGGAMEGPPLREEMISFVGAYPIPMRHGLSLGELALLFNGEARLGADLDIVPLRGWKRAMYFTDTGLPWVPPSPNLPTPDSALVYPGQVLLEGTNISEGRGTTRPFELCGAPYIDPATLLGNLRRMKIPGAVLREAWFEPTHQKWTGDLCGGLQIHVTDRRAFRPWRTTLTLLREVVRLWPEDFAWKEPPYEYERRRLPFDILSGDPRIRNRLEEGRPPAETARLGRNLLDRFRHRAENYFIYD
jgi:uncharacterized protein YbbC (DUF1343 family)